jgi:hypothetical protein
MKIPQVTILDHEKLREAQQILDEIMDDVSNPLHDTKHSMHKQVKEAVTALENEIFLLVCNLDGQFQTIDINDNNQHEELDPKQNLAQAELGNKRRNRRSKQDLITNKPRVRRKMKATVTVENDSLTVLRYDTKL